MAIYHAVKALQGKRSAYIVIKLMLSRQMIYGQQFHQNEFNQKNDIYWLPGMVF